MGEAIRDQFPSPSCVCGRESELSFCVCVCAQVVVYILCFVFFFIFLPFVCSFSILASRNEIKENLVSHHRNGLSQVESRTRTLKRAAISNQRVSLFIRFSSLRRHWSILLFFFSFFFSSRDSRRFNSLALHRTQPNPPTRNSSTTYGFFVLFS
jgi:hypothetical protein